MKRITENCLQGKHLGEKVSLALKDIAYQGSLKTTQNNKLVIVLDYIINREGETFACSEGEIFVLDRRFNYKIFIPGEYHREGKVYPQLREYDLRFGRAKEFDIL